MHLREFLYVDTEKVRSMLAQIEGGIEEDERNTVRTDKRTEGGVRGFASHYQNWADERYVNKSFGDALFPVLEQSLEVHNLLADISDQLTDVELWRSGTIADSWPAGSMVRITSPGSLFDSRFVASSLAGTAATYMGLQGLLDEGQSRQGASRGGNNRRSQGSRSSEGDGTQNLEDLIPDYQISSEMEFLPSSQLRALIRVARGLFSPGLHMNLTPTDDDEIVISARLQEGRQFLDSEPDVLFARYGLDVQEWTMVGLVGHHAAPASTTPSFEDFANDEGLKRGKAASTVNSFMKVMGVTGLTDLPQHPGFSMVPIAVYRTMITPASTELMPSP
ncbi:DUF6414 family protein [Actinomadura hibisca]|uniref:DUF6414 family protein n=1 Tax=Actinomadura hibisca TaxID=68565 RepID=UPI000B0604A7|nr:hypothetical protein [Actinomadura hibisca]